MAEFRVLLEGGAVLVVTLEVEEPEDAPLPEPENIGLALLNALGLNRPTVKAAGPTKGSKPGRRDLQTPEQRKDNEEDADAWLARTSKSALDTMKRGR